MTAPTIDDTQIAEAAFYLWLEEGRPEGREMDHWLRAQELLSAKAKAPAKRKPAAKAAATKTAKTTAAKTTAAKPAKAKAAPRKRKTAQV